jgi:NAD-dependent dihydropyrimidine dehydrogenase PreA subunit
MSAGLVYLPGVATLSLDAERCTGCGTCIDVCPHAVFDRVPRRVEIAALDRCIECGACSRNCPESAIAVEPGVGCAMAIIKGWLRRSESSCDQPTPDDAACGQTRSGHAPAAGGKPC